jgi:hypothetical protein
MMIAANIEPMALSIAVITGCSFRAKPSGIAAHNSNTPVPMTEAQASKLLIRITINRTNLVPFQAAFNPFMMVFTIFCKYYTVRLQKSNMCLTPLFINVFQ